VLFVSNVGRGGRQGRVFHSQPTYRNALNAKEGCVSNLKKTCGRRMHPAGAQHSCAKREVREGRGRVFHARPRSKVPKVSIKTRGERGKCWYLTSRRSSRLTDQTKAGSGGTERGRKGWKEGLYRKVVGAAQGKSLDARL